jgi:RNA polymerase sigma-70 factor, ECF subfamily
MQPFPKKPLSKAKTLKLFNEGKVEAHDAVYKRCHSALLILTRRMTHNSSSAEDLVNDAFEALFTCKKTFKEFSLLRDYLFKTARNICINYLKNQELTQKKYAEFKERRPYTDEDFYADISYSETRALIYECIEALPDKLRLVFELRYFDDLSNDAVAEELNIAGQTAYNRYHEARQKLKWDLEQIKNFTLYLLNLFL